MLRQYPLCVKYPTLERILIVQVRFQFVLLFISLYYLQYDLKQALAYSEKKKLVFFMRCFPLSNHDHLLYVGTRLLGQLFFILLERC